MKWMPCRGCGDARAYMVTINRIWQVDEAGYLDGCRRNKKDTWWYPLQIHGCAKGNNLHRAFMKRSMLWIRLILFLGSCYHRRSSGVRLKSNISPAFLVHSFQIRGRSGNGTLHIPVATRAICVVCAAVLWYLSPTPRWLSVPWPRGLMPEPVSLSAAIGVFLCVKKGWISSWSTPCRLPETGRKYYPLNWALLSWWNGQSFSLGVGARHVLLLTCFHSSLKTAALSQWISNRSR